MLEEIDDRFTKQCQNVWFQTSDETILETSNTWRFAPHLERYSYLTSVLLLRSLCYIPIDADLYVDFKNVLLRTPIFRIFQVIAIVRPKNLQDRQTMLYILDISVKIRVDWYAVQ